MVGIALLALQQPKVIVILFVEMVIELELKNVMMDLMIYTDVTLYVMINLLGLNVFIH